MTFLLWLAFAPAAAQIALPDYMNPGAEEGGVEEERDLPRHGSAEPGGEEGEEEKSPERLRRQLNSSRLNLTPAPDGEAPESVDRLALERLYLGGPERVRLVLETRERERLGGEVVNQTMLIETPIGSFPVRLHDLSRVERLEEGGYRFDFRDGDRLEGKPRLDALTLLNLDGSRRVIGFEDLQALSVAIPKE